MTVVSEISGRPRRVDAEQNIASILDAAVLVLGERPNASIGEIAAAAGVARQTVYAHFRSRQALVEAVAARALSEAVAAIDRAEPKRGPPGEALERLVRVWWELVARYARVLEALGPAVSTAGDMRAFHAPILDRLRRLIRRGQRNGEFDRQLDADWLALSFLALMHTAADEVAAERRSAVDAEATLLRSIPRLFAA